jgi:hypothetical protein
MSSARNNLAPINLVKTGDTSYGANGLLYKVRRISGIKKWALSNGESVEDAMKEFKEKLIETLKAYHVDLAYNIGLYQKYQKYPKNERTLEKINEVSKRIWDDTELMFKTLIPKYHSVKNFGRGTYHFLDRGFAYYLLFHILKTYHLDYRLIGCKAKPNTKINLSGVTHFEQVLDHLNSMMAGKFSTIKKVLSMELKLKWEAGSKLNLITRIHLMITLLKANIGEKKSKKTVDNSKLHCNKLIRIYNLLRKIKKHNIDNKSTDLNLYFELYREAVLDLVNIIDFYRKIVPEMNLIPYRGSIIAFHNNHVTGLSRAEFGYCLYYLITNDYVKENLLWNWTSAKWN